MLGMGFRAPEGPNTVVEPPYFGRVVRVNDLAQWGTVADIPLYGWSIVSSGIAAGPSGEVLVQATTRVATFPSSTPYVGESDNTYVTSVILPPEGASTSRIIGTPGDDVIQVSSAQVVDPSTGAVQVGVQFTLNGVATAPFVPTQTILIDGRSGNDAITIAPDVRYVFNIRGGDGNDTLRGGADFHYLIFGGAGDDWIYGGGARNALYGGLGNDTIIGAAGDDTLYGGEGHDLLEGGEGDDLLDAGPGIDTLYGHDGNDSLLGGSGDDELYGNAGDDTLDAGEGHDFVNGNTGRNHILRIVSPLGFYDTVLAGGGEDRITGGIVVDTTTPHVRITLTDGDDDVWFVYVQERYALRLGDDFRYMIEPSGLSGVEIDALAGDDDIAVMGVWTDVTLSGGSGNDTLSGSDGNDLILGGTGHDLIYGYAGNDSLYGGAGADRISGNDGHDLIRGGVGPDVLGGGGGNDTLYGGNGMDRLFGDDGDDSIEGNGKADVIFCGTGNDTAIGGAGSDSIYGEAGDDHLFAFGDPLFRDFLRGGDGADWWSGDDDDDAQDVWEYQPLQRESY